MVERESSGLWVSLTAEEQVSLLRSIVEGTARMTGTEFFQALVRNLARALGTRYSFVAELSDQKGYVRTLAMCDQDRITGNVEYALSGTPCEDVLKGSLCHHPARVAQRFPEDDALKEKGIDSYLGIPLLSKDGEVLGHLAVMDTKPMPDDPHRTWIFRIFADRAVAELERLSMEQMIQDSEQKFRDLFDEAPIAYVYGPFGKKCNIVILAAI